MDGSDIFIAGERRVSWCGLDLLSGVAEASFAAVGGGELVDFLPLGAGDGFDDHLGDAHGACDFEGLVAVVDEGDHDLSAVVGVDGAWGVGHGDAELGGDA